MCDKYSNIQKPHSVHIIRNNQYSYILSGSGAGAMKQKYYCRRNRNIIAADLIIVDNRETCVIQICAGILGRLASRLGSNV